jgi:NAD(P)-dependent dehydrogenase (short-subunit alcohol dehydrogenase family)
VTLWNLQKKVVVVTGGAGLLGECFAKAIAHAGGLPVLADIRLEEAEKCSRQINDTLGEESAFAVCMDITDKESILSAIVKIKSKYGQIDALVNNAYPRNENYGRRFEDIEFSDFCENVSLHLGGYFLASQQFALHFKEQGHGQVITMASVYGVIPPRFEIYEDTEMTMPVEYAATKSALIHLNKYMLHYFQGSGLRFNCLSPGGILDLQPKSFIKKYNSFAQSKGMLLPEDLTATLLFMLSDESKHLNGQNIVVDDGWSV